MMDDDECEGDDDEVEVDARTLLLLIAGYLRRRVQTHPVSTLSGVVAVGYVLGWSMPRVALRLGTAVAMRLLAVEVLEALLEGELLGSCGAGMSRETQASGTADPDPEAEHEDDAEHEPPNESGRPSRRVAKPFVA
ncbi:hypothetical protein OEB96_22070 [Paraliomyxa miuraensis]|nr:hypothetical protein [Paraliomyxa miuraensis]